MNPTPEQRKLVKGQGFLSNKDQIHFSARVITENGVLDARQIRLLADAAERFGNGNVSFTSRLTVELPGIAYEDIPAFQAFIAAENIVTGGTGPKVRPVVACKGTVCVFGNIDTQGLATEIHKRFFEGYAGVILPHKFKIAVGGCPNNCVKPNLNDIGIIGQRIPGGGFGVKVAIGGRWGRQIRIGTAGRRVVGRPTKGRGRPLSPNGGLVRWGR